MNKNNPFEGKAVKFDTAEQLEHLAELARGYGLEVSDYTKHEDGNVYFRYSIAYNSYSNFTRPNNDNTNYEIIHYSDFVKDLQQNTEHTPDMVNHPSHYNVEGFEVIDIIDAFGLNFNMGNALKYLLRADRKGNKEQDIQKALWYLQREINTK